MKPGKTKPLAWPAANVEMWPIGRVKPYQRNARRHPPEQIQTLRASIREFGVTTAVLVDEDGVLIYGHGRHQAMKEEGIDPVPVMVARGWSEAKKRAYRLADNKIAEGAEWNDDILRLEVMDLKAENFDFAGIGFDDVDLAAILDVTDGETDPEEIPEAPKRPYVRAGDLWVLGRHRLLCGDSTKAEDVERVLNDARPHLMVTDPPYGVDYDPDWRNRAARHSPGMGNRKIGAGAVGRVSNDDRADWREAWSLFAGDVAYVWHAGRFTSTVQNSLEVAGLECIYQIIWGKPRFVIGRGDYHWQHEPCWYAVRKGKNHRWAGDRAQTTLWQLEHHKNDTGHGTQKPIECMKRPIENNSKPGDGVYEPFCGSGTTIIAAEMTGRVCYALELDPAYVQVAVERWAAFSGQIPTCEGKTPEQIRKGRRTLSAPRDSGKPAAAKRRTRDARVPPGP